MNYTIIATNWNADQRSLRYIREVVFIHEQGISLADEWDDKDETAVHFIVTNSNSETIGCARLLIESATFHIGRVAVLANYRRQGVGRKLMQFIMMWCRQQNPESKIYLHAQISRIGFYENLGFVTHGDIFMDAGIPHIEMWVQI